jgi:photosystem II stability/assembly factor-like uncharacterized protein
MDIAILSLIQAEDRYTVTLETPRQGPLALAGTVWVDQQPRRDIVRVVDAVTELINQQAASGEPYRGDVSRLGEVSEVGTLAEFGQLMYGLFLPPIVQNALRELDAPLVITTNDAEIPWELLHNGRDFLGLRAPLARRLMVSRWVAGGEAALAAEPNFLLVADPLGDLPEAEAEADGLMAMLEARGVPYDLLRGPRATYVGVQQALLSGRYQVIHYTGHAVFDPRRPERTGLKLAGERMLLASQIEGVLRGHPLVFLNACSSAREAERQVAYVGPQAEGLAAAFLAGGAAGFVGAQWPIFDRGSRDFAFAFYQRLLDGASIGEALRVARSDGRARRPTDATWASFVFYGNPALRLAEPTADLLARAQRAAETGDWPQTLDLLAQAERRSDCPPEVATLAERARAGIARQEELAALYADGLACLARGDWLAAADCLGRVVAQDAGYQDAARRLAEARAALAQEEAARQGAKGTEGARGTRGTIVRWAAVAVVLVCMAVLAGFGATRFFAPAPVATPTPSPTPTPEPLVTPSPVPSPTPTIPPFGWQGLSGLSGSIVRALVTQPRHPRTLYAATWGGGVFQSSDGGEHWQASNAGLPSYHVYALLCDPITPTVVYAGTRDSGVFRSSDGGQTWAAASQGLAESTVYALGVGPAVNPGRQEAIYAGTDAGRLYRSEDGGQTWESLRGQIPAGAINAIIATPQGLLLVGSSGGAYRSTDGGSTWRKLALGNDVRDLAFHPQDERLLYAGVAGEGVFRSTDGGETWKALNKGLDNIRVRTLALDPLQPKVLYVGTDGGRLFRSANGGESWESAASGLSSRSVQALAIAPGVLYAGTWGEGVFRSTDEARSWRPANAGLSAPNINAVLAGGEPRVLLAALYGKGIFRSDDGGQTWVERSSGLTAAEDVLALVGDSAAPPMLYTTISGEGLFKSTDGGATWQAKSTGLTRATFTALAVAPADARLLYAGTSDGRIFRSQDAAETWRHTATITSTWVFALVVDPRNPDVAYVATAQHGVLQTTDGGVSWRTANQALTFTLLFDRATARLYAGTSQQGVLASNDGGQTWQSLGLLGETILALALDAAVPGTIYAGTWGHGVFVSRDGGATWQSLAPGLSTAFVQGLAVAPGWVYAATSNGLYAAAVPVTTPTPAVTSTPVSP